MIPGPLYEAGFKFRKTKLWQQLYDTQLFAVEHADGTTGYCCVMGKMGGHLALAVSPGAGRNKKRQYGFGYYRRFSSVLVPTHDLRF